MTVAVVLFTSDLRTHDHPPLHAAVAAADEVVPLFVRDPGIREAGFAVPNRDAFLADCLADLDASLRGLGGRLVLRSGPVATEVCAVAAESGATQVYMAAGVTGYAHRREQRLRDALRRQGVTLRVYEGVVTAVAPGAVTPVAPITTRSSRPTSVSGRTNPCARPCPRHAACVCPTGCAARHCRPARTCPVSRRGCRPEARRRDATGSRAGARPTWHATRKSTTTWPGTRPPGSRPTCTSGASHRSN